MLRKSLVIAAGLSLGLALSVPAGAQDNAQASAQDNEERINQLIVYGDDPCPVSTGADITVCARKDEAERFRIPEILRGSVDARNDAWNNKVLAYEAVLDSGPLSCSPTGGGGWLGCTDKMIQQAYAEKRTDVSLRFSQLIAEERAKRLSTIDETSAEAQARVEAEERARFEKDAAATAASPAGTKAP